MPAHLPLFLSLVLFIGAVYSSTCDPSQYYNNKKNACSDITVCSDTEYTSAPATPFSDRQCQPLCIWSQSYISMAPTPTTDAVCSMLTATCDVAVLHSPTPTSDRVCYHYPSGLNVTGPALLGSLFNPSSSQLAGYSAIIGTLVLTDYPYTSLVLPSLAYIDGNVIVSGNSSLMLLSLPKLMYITGEFGFDGAIRGADNKAITMIDLPQLVRVDSFLTLLNSNGQNKVLKSANIQSLTYVGSLVQVTRNTVLTALDVSQLQYVGASINFANNPAMKSLAFNSLTYVAQYFEVYSFATLTSLAAPRLTYVGAYILVEDNGKLIMFSAPALTTVLNIGKSYSWFVSLCGNAASFSYSAAITNAVAGQSCHFPPVYCKNVSTTCTLACSAGTFASGAATCFNCPAGTYSTVAGAMSSSTCVNCNAGTYTLAPGSTSCMNCSTGA